MKKLVIMCMSLVFALIFTACNSEGATEDGLSIEDILNNSIESMEDLSSYAVHMDSEQIIGLSDEDSMTMKTSSNTELTMEPLNLYQEITADMGMLGGEMTYESYFSEEHGIFIEEPMTGEWIQFSSDLSDQLLNVDTQLNPEEQLEPLKEHISQLSLHSTDDTYVITLKGEDVGLDEILEPLTEMTNELDQLMDLMSGNMEIHSLEYEITFDKETFYQLESNIFMEMTVNLMGEEVHLDQQSNFTMDQFDEVSEIQIPNDVLENAKGGNETDLFIN